MSKLERYKRNYQVDGSEVFYVHDGHRHRTNWSSYPARAEGCPPATPEQIAAFEAEEDRLAANAKAIDDKERSLLALCGLIRDDFCRLRSVSRDGTTLYVSTRENGVGEVSGGALKNPNFLERENDDCDCTYAHYTFSIPPEAGEADLMKQRDALKEACDEAEQEVDRG